METSTGSASPNSKDKINPSNVSAQQNTGPSSHEDCWKSEDVTAHCFPDDSKEFLDTMPLKKSQYQENMLENERGYSCDDGSEDVDMDLGSSFHYSHDKKNKGVGDLIHISSLVGLYDPEDLTINYSNKHEENAGLDSLDFTDPLHQSSLFSIGTLEHLDEKQLDGIDELSADHAANYERPLSDAQPTIVRSQSVNFMMDLNGDDALRSPHKDSAVLHSHSSHQASSLDGKGSPGPADATEECRQFNKCNEKGDEEKDSRYWNEMSFFSNQPFDEKHSPCSSNSDGINQMRDQGRDGKHLIAKPRIHYQSVDGYISEYSCQAFDWGKPETGGVEFGQNLQHESSIPMSDELAPGEFNLKRIKDWIDQLDTQNDTIVEEIWGNSNFASRKDPQVVGPVSAKKLDSRSSLGMESAYNYISTLNAASSSAHMANLGLVAVPIISAFVGLRVLNLSGNSIVRITAGALPKGLHMLNLSKNNISVIEGFRDLTRLRVLDLSYNRILRISHGLSSCSSLKELYLAGNKISEVESLHRLLKLNTLDLRSNKISSSKSLGQLAANYSSLQAINLDGNPVQKNVGDEHLKKYLLSLLPHLASYNKQTIRASGSKEASDRSSRFISSHQNSRGVRSEHKLSGRTKSGVGASKSLSSSNHNGTVHAMRTLPKVPTSQNLGLPPTVSKPTGHLPNMGRRLLGLQISSPIRRIRSEGAL
ncbi:uncharacterized protein [Typha latifolia]|uniref:uncharacterized protein n=1 Tax=Typha latifolia TaxID=4733 RepID=UPI003C2D9907